ncbi:uncharacterized protein CANTADRAFT_49948, partial [Suhomyces tanzawaensis NRRL Y-17324]
MEISTIPIHLMFGDKGFAFPDLIPATQLQLDYHITQMYPSSPFRLQLVDNLKSSLQVGGTININDWGKNNYVVELVHGEENEIFLDPNLMKVTLFYTLASIHSNDLPFLVTQTIMDHLSIAELT